ncbi:MAG: hypothetical protein Q3979_08510 [Actinomycetaceae bacterium]|nr:hypothetical protein [Actinomycetaceae bacterium]
MLREILIDLRTNGAMIAIKAAVIVLVGLGVYNVHAFSESTEAAVDRSFSSQAGVNMYTMHGEFLDPEDYERFSASRDQVEGLARFYDLLNADREITFLSAYDNPLTAIDFPGDETFGESYGSGSSTGEPLVEAGHTLTDVKSMQMNRKTFEFYKLRAAEGSAIDWEAVDYSSGRIPVMLGDAYRGTYDVGSTFKGEFYFREFTFEVVGFLPKDASMYFFGEFNQYLDHHILLPYPPRLEGCTALEQDFCANLTSAAINTDMAVPKGTSTNDLLTRLNALSSASGFDRYGVNSISTHAIQLSFMRKLIENNSGLLQALVILVAVLAAFVLFVVNRHVAGRRAKKAGMWQLMGASRAAVEKRLWGLRAVEYALAGVVLTVAALHMPQHNPMSMFVAAGVVVGAAVFELATNSGGRDDLAQ